MLVRMGDIGNKHPLCFHNQTVEVAAVLNYFVDARFYCNSLIYVSALKPCVNDGDLMG